MNSKTLFLALGLLLICVGMANAHANQCNPGISCQCVDFVIDNGWHDFNNSGNAKNWFAAAPGRGYATGHSPQVGAVLVWTGDIGAGAGHVAIVTRVISSTEIRIDHANYALNGAMDQKIYRDIGVKDASGGNWTKVKTWYSATNDRNNVVWGSNDYSVYGFIYPKGMEMKMPTKAGHAWIPGESDAPEDATKAFRIEDDDVTIRETSWQDMLDGIAGCCADIPSQQDVDQVEDSAERRWYQKIWDAIKDSSHFLFGANPAYTCDSTIEYRTFRLPGHPQSESYLSSGKKNIPLLGLPLAGTSPVPKAGPKPDITVDYDVFRDAGRDHEISANCNNCPGKPVVAGRTIYHRLEMEVKNRNVTTSDLRNAKSKSIDGKIECRVVGHTNWKEIPRSEEDLEYNIGNLKTKENTSVEVIPYVVPDYPDATLECRAYGDDDDEVREEKESNNNSRIERFLIRSFAQCNIVVENVGLVDASLTLNLGDSYGLEMLIASTGSTGCENDIRSSYAIKRPGQNAFEQVDDDGTNADDYLCSECRAYEYTKDMPFIATNVGVHVVRACADYLNANTETSEGDNCKESMFEVVDPMVAPPEPEPVSGIRHMSPATRFIILGN